MLANVTQGASVFTQIFPYVNQMVWDLGVTDNRKKVGFYSGIIDSAFAFAQMFTVYSYGSLSGRNLDRLSLQS